jgi:predicted glycoside hydrolase/deacetylase ChbG (UPF0249 family)
MRWLIVTGDDFGASRGINRGILAAHSGGILTSTSLLVDRPASESAALDARAYPGLSVGLHLELDPELPDGVEEQLQSQLARFIQLVASPPTHVDSHHDAHRDPRVLPQVIAWSERVGIPLRGHSPARHLSRFYGRWNGRSHPERIGVDGLLDLIDSEVGEGVTELSCHPGIVDPGLRSSYFTEREVELRTLCHPAVRQGLEDREIHLIGFRGLPTFATTEATNGGPR